MSQVVEMLNQYSHIESIWASPRELFNAVQADQIGCDYIITVTNDIVKKSSLCKDLTRRSRNQTGKQKHDI